MARTVFKLGTGVFGLVLAMVMVVGLASPSFASAYMKPTVTHLSPTSGTTLGGNTVTITGKYYTGFGKSLVKTVWFGGTWKGTNIHVQANSQLTVTAPRGAGTKGIRVVTAGGMSSASSADLYTFVAPVSTAPVVSSVSPNTGSTLGGTSVTITGTNLLGATGVMFGTTPALFQTSVGGSITAVAPAGTVGMVNVTVTTPAGTSALVSADQFTYAAPQTNAITAFGFASPAVTGTIDQVTHAIAVTVPWGTNVSALVANFTAPGATVTVATTPQVSGTTANDFSNPATYTVTAANGTAQNYTVTVTVAASSAKAITAFSLMGVNGTINQSNDTIVVNLPYTPDVTALVATFTTTGASVSVGSTPQVSGTTANNFTNPVTYTVTAANGTTQNYVVTVTVDEPTTIAVHAGNTQSAVVGTAVATPPSVLVTDANSNPVSGVSVTFA
ncbi:MAG: IPT/TIG domain-containing protein, partial [Thermoleophilia bacterium]